MDHSAEFHDMSARRADQLLVRLGMAVCIGVFAYTLKPSIWPGLWFVAVVVTQLFENFWVDRPLRRKKPALSARTRILIAALSGFNAAVFVSLSIYSWSDGSAGQMFATMLICGGLLHVCLHLYTVRMVQVAGAFAPCLFLFALPVISEIQHSGLHPAAIFVMLMSAALYLAHLLLGVSQNNQINSSLIAANAHAQQQQKLAEAESRSKSDFLATISHEIRTPLNAVTSAAHLLNETDMSERQEEFVSILLNGSEVLLNLINEVLDMSKIEAGKMTLDITDVDLHELASKILGLWKGPAEQRGLSIEVTIDPSAPQFISADKLRLSQVLFNLVSNAVKFTDVGGVRLLIRAAEDPADRIGRHLVFEVVDTGPGLEAEVMARLFNSFEQADAGTTRRHGGTGLGLAISRRLAELMEGSLTVESAVGQGSAFRLTIPLVEREPIADEPADEPSAAEPAVSARPLSILIAEDHEVNRRLLRFMLEPLGGDLTMVENGELAVAAAARRPFDAILMDFQMPVMSGLEATRRIRAGEGPNAHCPIIAITANAFDEQRRDWTEAGANAFLTKPIDPPALFAALSNCT